uniref:Uncharacterized protein n=1 Tax=Cacopsylla melanoneura TaxID=428564 RepID=A0A8D8WMX6_9HEMI
MKLRLSSGTPGDCHKMSCLFKTESWSPEGDCVHFVLILKIKPLAGSNRKRMDFRFYTSATLTSSHLWRHVLRLELPSCSKMWTTLILSLKTSLIRKSIMIRADLMLV